MNIQEPIDLLLRGRVRWRSGDAASHTPGRRGPLADDLTTLSRVVRRVPEVMVRITGKAAGAKHVKRHLSYITRNGELPAEDERGQLVVGPGMVKGVADSWMLLADRHRRQRSRDTCNIVLSMPAGTDPDKLLEAARAFAQRTFGDNHAYLFVRHTHDTDPAKRRAEQPHVHLTVRSLGFNGQRLNPRKADLWRWRSDFADACRAHGIEANATPRRARGVSRRSVRQPVLHADRAKRSTVQKQKVAEAIRFAAVGGAEPSHWQRQAKEARRGAIGAWRAIADELQRSELPSGAELAHQIDDFLRRLPAPQIERQALCQEVAKLIQQKRKQADGQEPTR